MAANSKGENKTKRIRTELNQNDQYLRVKLDQDYDRLKVLSLTVNQDDIYNDPSADFGVVVGRVVSSGVGIPNARVSIFIPIDDVDAANDEIFQRYPYETTQDRNAQGKKYNLLPKLRRWVRGVFDPSFEWKPNRFGVGLTPPEPIGSFPDKIELMNGTAEAKTLRQIYGKYYKYTTVTNASGDYMIYGVPTGTQEIHLDVDLTDIGPFSVRPASLKADGYSENFFEDGKIKTYNDLDKNPHYKSQSFTINVRPFWGDDNTQEIGITRQDFNLNTNITPTFTFGVSSFTMGEGDFWGDKVVFRIWLDWPLVRFGGLFIPKENKRILRKQFDILRKGGLLCLFLCRPRVRFQIWTDTNMSRLSGGFDESNPFQFRISPPKVGLIKVGNPSACKSPCDENPNFDDACGKCNEELEGQLADAATEGGVYGENAATSDINCNVLVQEDSPVVEDVAEGWDGNEIYEEGDVVRIIPDSLPPGEYKPVGYGWTSNGDNFIVPVNGDDQYDIYNAEEAELVDQGGGVKRWESNGNPINLLCDCDDPDSGFRFTVDPITFDGYIAQTTGITYGFVTGATASTGDTTFTTVTLNSDPNSWQKLYGDGQYPISPTDARKAVEVPDGRGGKQVVGYFSGQDFWAQQTITINEYEVKCNDYVLDGDEKNFDFEQSTEEELDLNQQLRPENFRNLPMRIDVVSKLGDYNIDDPDFDDLEEFVLLNPDQYELYNDKAGVCAVRVPCSKVKKATDELGNLIDVGEDEEGVFTEFDGYFLVTLEGGAGLGPRKTRVRRPIIKVPASQLALRPELFVEDGDEYYQYPTYNYNELKSEWANFKFGRVYSSAMRLGVEPYIDNKPTDEELDNLTERGVERYAFNFSQFNNSSLPEYLRKGYYYDATNRFNESDVTGEKDGEVVAKERDYSKQFNPFGTCYWEKPGAIDLLYDGDKDGFEGLRVIDSNQNPNLERPKWPCAEYFFYNDWLNFSLFFPQFAFFKKARRDRYSPYILGIPLQRPRRGNQGAYRNVGYLDDQGVKEIEVDGDGNPLLDGNGNTIPIKNLRAGFRHASIDNENASTSDDTNNAEYLINHDFFPTAVIEVPNDDIVSILNFTVQEELTNGKLQYIPQRKGFVIAVDETNDKYQLYRTDLLSPSSDYVITGSTNPDVNVNLIDEDGNQSSLLSGGFYKYIPYHTYKDFEFDMNNDNKPAYCYMGLKDNHLLLYMIEKNLF